MTEQIKIWGTTEPLIVTPMFEMHRLRIKSMHRCSFHVHRFKHNLFFVLEGELFIDMADRSLLSERGLREEEEDGSVRLHAQEYMTIRPAVHHQFRTGAVPCVALEAYFTEPLSTDIVRLNEGGALVER
jgi:mannose-6-phosphate isomerase-like protein (cupin superfamily)